MDRYCRICHNTSCNNHGKDITFLGEGWKCNYIPVPTNFVDTAYYYDWKKDEDYYYFPNGTTKTNYKPKAVEAWLEWLKQPAEG
jgi:hypothetical protein